MANRHAYISTKPRQATFSIPFTDGSGDKLKVVLQIDRVIIHDAGDSIHVNAEEIDWLIDVLRDAKSLMQMEETQVPVVI